MSSEPSTGVTVNGSAGVLTMAFALPGGIDVQLRLTRGEALRFARLLGRAVLDAWPECRACLGHGVMGDGHPDPDAPCPTCKGRCYEGV